MSETHLRDTPRFTRQPERTPLERARRWLGLAGTYLRAALRLEREQLQCPICGGERLELLVIGDRPDMLSCHRCRLIFRAERPSAAELLKHYAAEPPVEPLPAAGEESYQRHKSYCFNELGLNDEEARRGPLRRALDVGCGGGHNLAVLQSRGWEVEGIDPNPHRVQQVAARGFTAEVADLGQAARDPKRSGRYQLITMLHVIEHLQDPLAELRGLAPLLDEGGLLLLETPLCCDLTNRSHLHFFSGASLHILLERSAFKWQSEHHYVAQNFAHDNLLVLARKLPG